jgi:hypothetical protein
VSPPANSYGAESTSRKPRRREVYRIDTWRNHNHNRLKDNGTFRQLGWRKVTSRHLKWREDTCRFLHLTPGQFCQYFLERAIFDNYIGQRVIFVKKAASYHITCIAKNHKIWHADFTKNKFYFRIIHLVLHVDISSNIIGQIIRSLILTKLRTRIK